MPPVTAPAFTDLERTQLDVAASSLSEWLHGPFDRTSARADAAQERLAAWQARFGDDTPDAFAARLRLEGVRLTDVLPRLAPERRQPGVPGPAWLDLLDRAVGDLLATPPHATLVDRAFDEEEALPFEDLLVPFLRVARDRVETLLGAPPTHLTPSALAGLERALLRSLSALASRTLFARFGARRSIWSAFGKRPEAMAPDSAGQHLYRAFVAEMRDGRFRDFLLQYPVLGRLLAVLTLHWVRNVTTLEGRLAEDAGVLAATFGAGTDLGDVVKARADLSDPHHGGQTVVVLTFASGVRVVYKPRSLDLDVAFYDLTRWLNGRGQTPALRTLQVIDRTSHGWVEFVDNAPISSAEGVRAYYRRAGSQLCLAYVLQGSDLHRGNLIASGEHPVLVDLEVLLQPMVREHGTQSIAARREIQERVHYSVLHTGLLPHWVMGASGERYDVSGYGNPNSTDDRIETGYHHVNTDAMTMGRIPLPSADEYQSMPILDGQAMLIADYVDEVVDGFELTYRLLLEGRDDLLTAGSPLAGFGGRRVRHVFRNTATYGRLLRASTLPECLRSGWDRSLFLEQIARPFVVAGSDHPHWPILRAELAALEHMDVPYFVARTDSEALLVGDGALPLHGFFQGHSYGLMHEKVAGMSESDCDLQAGFIRGAIRSYTLQQHGGGEATIVRPLSHYAEAPILSREELLAEAERIGRRICDQAVFSSDGSATWFAPTYSPQHGIYQFSPLSYTLYDGTAGVALFLGALDTALGGGSRFGAVAESALRPILASSDVSNRWERAATVGGAMGIGSVLYGLSRTGLAMGRPEYDAEARRAAAQITPERIQSDTGFDVCVGSAGALLTLVALYESGGGDDLIARARVAADHLLDHRVEDPVSGLRAWPTLDGKLLTGFSHGASGIAYALLRLYRVTGDDDLRAAAREGFAYETDLYVPALTDWPDVRLAEGTEETARILSTWCHGAAGIGLARAATLTEVDDPILRAEIAQAVATSLAQPPTSHDHYCCGHLGRGVLLHTAAGALGRPEWADEANALLTRIVARAAELGGYGVVGDGAHNSPGFFQGLAGIGYALVRAACPGRFTETLLWE